MYEQNGVFFFFFWLQHEKVSNLLSKYIGKPISQIESLAAAQAVPMDYLSLPGNNNSVTNQGLVDQPTPPPGLDLDLSSGGAHAFGNFSNTSTTAIPTCHIRAIPDLEKALMSETAAAAMDELVRLLQIDDPLWVKSPSGGRCSLHRDTYESVFPRANHFKTSSARFESSKYSAVVVLNAMNLVDMLLDSVSGFILYFLISPFSMGEHTCIKILTPSKVISQLFSCRINGQISFLLLSQKLRQFRFLKMECWETETVHCSWYTHIYHIYS